MSDNIRFIDAKPEHISIILDMIKALAEYEGMLDQVVATEEILNEWVFEKKKAEVILLEVEGVIAGFALLFYNFSTFLGRAGIYIEDLFVYPEYRGQGYGKKLFKKVAKLAATRGCGRVEWWCLDWNQPSIDFYKSMGAEVMDEWSVYRLTGENLKKLSES